MARNRASRCWDFYRSHTLPDFAVGEEDQELMRSHFAPEEDLVLLVKPGLMGASDEDFCFRHCGGTAAAPVSVPPPLMNWPLPRSRQETPGSERAGSAARRRWPWYMAAALFGLVCGALGYLWWHPDTGVERLAVSATAPPSAQPIVEGAPAPPAPDTAGIPEFLDRWAAALRRGDVNAAVECYAPVVSTYFNRHDVTRELVGQTIRQARARYGRLDVYRISGLSLNPVSESRAVATFRKHWQFSGRVKSAGEEEERMTLVRGAGAWKISSEQATAN